MNKEKILQYLNAKTEYSAIVNLKNYTEQKSSIVFDDDGIILINKKEKKFLKYNEFTKEQFDEIVDK